MRRSPTSRHAKTRHWIAAVTIALAVAASTFFWPVQARPGTAMIAVFAPWLSRTAVLRAAALSGVHILGGSRIPGAVLLSVDDPLALGKLYRAGAWTLLSTAGVAGCFDLPDRVTGGDGSGA